MFPILNHGSNFHCCIFFDALLVYFIQNPQTRKYHSLDAFGKCITAKNKEDLEHSFVFTRIAQGKEQSRVWGNF